MSPLFRGVLDIRWDPPAIQPKNSKFNIVGVNVYRSLVSERGPYERLNVAPVGGVFYRDITDNALVEDEVVDWEGSWLSRGEEANARRWTFRTRNIPVIKRVGQGIPANSPDDVQLTIDDERIPVQAVFGPTGEVTLINTRGFDFATERWVEPVLPIGPETAVSVTYYYSRGILRTDLDRKIWYRLTTVALDPTAASGFRETPLSYSEPVTYRAVERLDYIWREAVRRNNWILEQGGERVKVFLRKSSGIPCYCGRDPRTLEYAQQPNSRCDKCFPPGTEITMGDFTRKPIEKVVIGDEVLTHEGRVRRVYDTMHRQVQEHLIEIKATHGVGFSPTANHPVLIVRREDARCVRGPGVCTGPATKVVCTGKSWAKSCERTPQPIAQWVRADSVREGDYLVFCPPNEERSTNGMSRERLRVLGYYASEGNTGKKQRRDGSMTPDDKSTVFAFHVDEIPTFVTELQQCLRVEYGAASSVRRASGGNKGCSLAVSRQAVAQDMLAHVGKHSTSKRLSGELVWQLPEKAREFLGAYFNGDGWQCLNKSRTHLGVSTASYDMARQVETMFLRQGVVPRFDWRHRTGIPNPNRFGTHSTTEHTVVVRKTDMHVLAKTMQKMQNVSAKVRRSGQAVSVGGLVLYPVRSVRRVSYEGLVYNLEVEEDHSYVANGAIAHNCFGTGFLGGYDGPIDMIVSPDDNERAVRQSPNGRHLDHSQDVWTGPTPLLTQRDFIVKLTNERYSIGPVRKPSNRGNILQQHFMIRYLDEQDIRYQVPLFDTTMLCWPETRLRPAVLQGGAWAAEYAPRGPYPVGADYQQTPLQTEKQEIPNEREQRGRTPVWENITY